MLSFQMIIIRRDPQGIEQRVRAALKGKKHSLKDHQYTVLQRQLKELGQENFAFKQILRRVRNHLKLGNLEIFKSDYFFEFNVLEFLEKLIFYYSNLFIGKITKL